MGDSNVRKLRPKRLIKATVVRVNFGRDRNDPTAPEFGFFLHVPSHNLMVGLTSKKRLSAWEQEKTIEPTLLPNPEPLEWVVGEIDLDPELVELYTKLLPMHLRLREEVWKQKEFNS